MKKDLADWSLILSRILKGERILVWKGFKKNA